MSARGKNTCPSMDGTPTNTKGSRAKVSQGNTDGTPSAGESSQGTPDTPSTTRKNKRKMSAPRKRSDAVPVKRINLEDGHSDLFYDDGDDDVLGVKKLTPDPLAGNSPRSASSEDRNNSTGSGPSPAPVVLPQQIPPQFLTSMAGLYPAPVMTTVGGIPRYIIPGMPPGFMPHPGFVPPGLPGMTLPPGVHPAIQKPHTSPDMDKNHNCLRHSDLKEPSPSGSQGSAPSPSPSVSSVLDPDDSPSDGSRRNRKNYKNMTRERRVEANARERTRVHTISAAFDGLRKAVPSYSYHQRLSKLAILRIACSYILALSRLADMDYSEEQDALSFSDCVDLCTQTIQSEGRAKRRH